MMRSIALFGLVAGGILAAGQLSAAQWHTAGQALLALTLTHGLTVLPWLIAALFAALWWRERRTAWLWSESYRDQTTYYAALRAEQERSAAQQVATQRKRRTSR